MTDNPTPAATAAEETARREFWETPRPVSHEEANAAAYRLINSHFRQEPGARASIPARPDYDDDLILMSYIRQQSRLSQPAPGVTVEEIARTKEARDHAHNLGREGFWIDIADYDALSASRTPAPGQSGAEGLPQELSASVLTSLARSIGSSAGDENHQVRAKKAWAAICAAWAGGEHPIPPAPAPQAGDVSGLVEALRAQVEVSKMLMRELKYPDQDILDCTSQACAALAAQEAGK